MRSIKNRKREFAIVCVSLFVLGLLLLVSASNTNNDTMSIVTINGSDGTIFNVTATPQRQKDNNNIGFVTVNITTNKNINKSFNLMSDHGETIMTLNDNNSVSLNTTVFNVPSNGFNKSYNLTDNDSNESISLSVEFKNDKIYNPLSDIISPSQQGQVVVGVNGTTIQDAVNAASSGDTVIIPAGTYTGDGNRNININGKNLTIKGSGDVVIDAQNTSGTRIFTVSNGMVNITGLKMQNSASGYNHGGAVYFTSGSGGSSVINCSFTNCNNMGSNSMGGAVYFKSNGSVINCNFTNTNSGDNGGAVYFSSDSVCSVTGSTFINTTTTMYTSFCGGGIFFSGSNGNITVTDSTFINTSAGKGGGIHLYSAANALIDNCRFDSNLAVGDMGAIGIDQCSNVVINNSVIKNNTATSRAGGIGVGARYSTPSSNVVIENCNITGNRANNSSELNAGGIAFNATGDSKIVNCIISNNSAPSGGGISIANGDVINCIISNNIVNNTVGGAAGGIYLNNGGSVTNCTISGNRVFSSVNNGNGGGIFGNGLVTNSIIANNTVQGGGGGIFNSTVTNSTITGNNATSVGGGVANCNVTNSIIKDNNAAAGGGVADGNVTNCTITGNNVGGIITDNSGVVNYCRIFNNTNYGGFNVGNSSCNIDFNWWGQNNITNLINGTLPNNYYQIELSANQVSTRDLNTSVNGTIPVPLGYKMCLNGSNNTGNINNLPDFNATIKLSNNTGLFRFLPFMSPGESVNILAKDPWNDTINNPGNYIFSALVDNQQLNISFATEKANTSLSLTASDITYEDNTNITATLTSDNGTGLINKNLTFNINGTDYNVTTNGLGVAVLNISGLHAGSYNVSVSFDGDDGYNPSTNNTTFNVGKRDTSLSISKTVNSTNPVVGDLVGYTIKVMNNGTNNISTLILVNDTLSSSLEFVGSSASVGDYSHSSGLWTILGLNSGDTATLNITVRVKSSGNLVNRAFLVLDDYNNSLTNDSSVDITVKPNGSGGNGTDGSGSDNGGSGGFDGLAKTGLPLIFLLLLSVLGVYYWRKK
ncbi:MAG: DUF11 domain-containing protein [Methanobrevibacter sp. CfCl-M3]